jgi:hypothetical protein
LIDRRNFRRMFGCSYEPSLVHCELCEQMIRDGSACWRWRRFCRLFPFNLSGLSSPSPKSWRYLFQSIPHTLVRSYARTRVRARHRYIAADNGSIQERTVCRLVPYGNGI